jgi:hypothetical protein
MEARLRVQIRRYNLAEKLDSYGKFFQKFDILGMKV